MKTLQIGDSSKEIPCGTSSSTRDDWKFLDIRSGDIGQNNEIREVKAAELAELLEGSPTSSGWSANYSLGKNFKPDEETLGRRQKQVLELLKERGPQGATRLDVPDHLALSWAQRICELRRMGYRIVTKREIFCWHN